MRGWARAFFAAIVFCIPVAVLQISFAPAQNGPQQSGGGAPVEGVPVNRSTLNQSVKITTGLTYQSVLASNLIVSANGTITQRAALIIQNNNATDNCYLIIGTSVVTPGTTTTTTSVTIAGASLTALQASITLLAGGSYQRYWPYVPSDTIYATCATSGDSLYIDVE